VSTVGHIAEGRLSVENAPVETMAIAAAAVEAVPERADGRAVVLRPGVSATVQTDIERAARAVALVAEAALRLEPGSLAPLEDGIERRTHASARRAAGI